jgi:mono/diheme cytochrome c family protein
LLAENKSPMTLCGKHSWWTAGARVAAATALVAVVLTFAGCNSQAGTSSAAASPSSGVITQQAREEASQLFAARCAACHGDQGRGDGPGGGALNPKPRNFHDAAWQKSITDEQIEKAILLGGAGTGKSPLMAANPDLQAKPAVVAALRERIRQMGAAGN